VKVRLTINKLDDFGDIVSVTASGNGVGEADWRTELKWSFTVPYYVGKRYRLGQTLIMDIHT